MENKKIKKLDFAPRITNSDFRSLERMLNVKIPELFMDFMKDYANSSTIQDRIFDEDYQQFWIINEFTSYTEMYNLSKRIVKDFDRKMLVFGNDPNGMLFFLSLEELDYNNVYILNVDISKEFIKISNSFDEFINNLVSYA